MMKMPESNHPEKSRWTRKVLPVDNYLNSLLFPGHQHNRFDLNVSITLLFFSTAPRSSRIFCLYFHNHKIWVSTVVASGIPESWYPAYHCSSRPLPQNVPQVPSQTPELLSGVSSHPLHQPIESSEKRAARSPMKKKRHGSIPAGSLRFPPA